MNTDTPNRRSLLHPRDQIMRTRERIYLPDDSNLRGNISIPTLESFNTLPHFNCPF